MKRKIYLLVGIVIIFLIAIIAIYLNNQNNNQTINLSTAPEINNENVTSGTEKYQNFILDNTLHSKDYGDIHYNVYIPDSYDGSEPYALYMTLPGYQGLYFQGVGENLKTEEFGFVAPEYNSKMIIVAPQLDDWQELSANQTIELTEYFLSNYNIDSSRVYANGYSGGGETMSIVMGKRPDLFSGYLHCSSKWDGDYQTLVNSETPIYIVIGENDEYYGLDSSKQTYQDLYELYRDKGLSDQEIDQLLVLDVKDNSYFESQGASNQHGQGAHLFAHDKNVMGWLFNQIKGGDEVEK